MKIQDIKNIIRLANHLDNIGLYKEADSLDSIINSSIRKIAGEQSLLEAISYMRNLPRPDRFIYPISQEANMVLEPTHRAVSYYLDTSTGKILIDDNQASTWGAGGDYTPEEWKNQYGDRFQLTYRDNTDLDTNNALMSLEYQYGVAIKSGGMNDPKMLANYKIIAELLTGYGWDPRNTLTYETSDLTSADLVDRTQTSALVPEEDMVSMQPEITSTPQVNRGCANGFNPDSPEWIRIPDDEKFVYKKNPNGTFSGYSIRECGKKVSSSITVQQMRAAGASGPEFALERPTLTLEQQRSAPTIRTVSPGMAPMQGTTVDASTPEIRGGKIVE